MPIAIDALLVASTIFGRWNVLTSNRSINPNKLVEAQSDVFRGLMFGIQNGPRVDNIYFIVLSLEIG